MRLLKEMFIIFLGIAAAIYLINPTLGILEFLPDNLPLVGNIDEATATALLLSVLGYYGLDLTRIFGRRAQHPLVPQAPSRSVQPPSR